MWQPPLVSYLLLININLLLGQLLGVAPASSILALASLAGSGQLGLSTALGLAAAVLVQGHLDGLIRLGLLLLSGNLGLLLFLGRGVLGGGVLRITISGANRLGSC